MRVFPLLLLVALCGCKHIVGGQPTIDPDALMLVATTELRNIGEDYQAKDNFGLCIMGVALEAFADGTQNWALPIKEAIETGAESGDLDSFVIDPSACIGLPGTPETAEDLDAARKEVQEVFDAVIPPVRLGLRLGSSTAAMYGETAACVHMTRTADMIDTGSDFIVQILTVIEEPGAPFEVPGGRWSTAGCGVEEPAPEPEMTPVTVEAEPAVINPVVPDEDPEPTVEETPAVIDPEVELPTETDDPTEL